MSKAHGETRGKLDGDGAALNVDEREGRVHEDTWFGGGSRRRIDDIARPWGNQPR